MRSGSLSARADMTLNHPWPQQPAGACLSQSRAQCPAAPQMWQQPGRGAEVNPYLARLQRSDGAGALGFRNGGSSMRRAARGEASRHAANAAADPMPRPLPTNRPAAALSHSSWK